MSAKTLSSPSASSVSTKHPKSPAKETTTTDTKIVIGSKTGADTKIVIGSKSGDTKIVIGSKTGADDGSTAGEGPKKEITKKKKHKRSFDSKIKKMNSAINKALIDAANGDKKKKQGMEKNVPMVLNDIAKHILRSFTFKALDRIKRRKVKTISAKDALETTLCMIAEAAENCSIIPRKPIVEAQANEFRTEYLQKFKEIKEKSTKHKEYKKAHPAPKKEKKATAASTTANMGTIDADATSMDE